MKIGHRGAKGHPEFYENTFSSFILALQLGANAIEFDVRRCKDDIVVFHDKSIFRTTGGRCTEEVRELSYAELNDLCRRYAFRHGFTKVPRFRDVLRTLGKLCFLHIELKEHGVLDEAKRMVCKLGIQKNVCFSAFEIEDYDEGEVSESSWGELWGAQPEIPFALIASRRKMEFFGPEGLVRVAKDFKASAVHVRHQLATRELVEHAHGQGLLVNVFVANEPGDILRLKNVPVDGIMSDFPERL